MTMFAEFRDMNREPVWVNTDTVAFVGRAGNHAIPETAPTQLTFVGGHTVAVQGTVEEAVAKLQWVYVPPDDGIASAYNEGTLWNTYDFKERPPGKRLKPHLPRPKR